ncbi:MAG TPA: hypothetical protein VGK19_19865 [Capsulimonadaceae bacterium]
MRQSTLSRSTFIVLLVVIAAVIAPTALLAAPAGILAQPSSGLAQTETSIEGFAIRLPKKYAPVEIPGSKKAANTGITTYAFAGPPDAFGRKPVLVISITSTVPNSPALSDLANGMAGFEASVTRTDPAATGQKSKIEKLNGMTCQRMEFSKLMGTGSDRHRVNGVVYGFLGQRSFLLTAATVNATGDQSSLSVLEASIRSIHELPH